MRRIIRAALPAAVLALTGLMMAPAAADEDDEAGKYSSHEHIQNDRDTQVAADDDDNLHPSGKDRSVEAGRSGTQGKSPSDPDGDSNGGEDKPGGTGGIDKDDQDGNNGCGNDDDFEDDNNGNCGGLKSKDDAESPESQKSDVRGPDSDAAVLGAALTDSRSAKTAHDEQMDAGGESAATSSGSNTAASSEEGEVAVLSQGLAAPAGEDAAAPADDTTAAAAGDAVAAAPTGTGALAFTGFPAILAAIAGLGMTGLGVALLRRRS